MYPVKGFLFINCQTAKRDQFALSQGNQGNCKAGIIPGLSVYEVAGVAWVLLLNDQACQNTTNINLSVENKKISTSRC